MKDFFKRLRTAWAVLRGDYKWVADNADDLSAIINGRRVDKSFPATEEEDARLTSAGQILSKNIPFIAIWKLLGNCYVSYCGTEQELEELKNQEITID